MRTVIVFALVLVCAVMVAHATARADPPQEEKKDGEPAPPSHNDPRNFPDVTSPPNGHDVKGGKQRDERITKEAERRKQAAIEAEKNKPKPGHTDRSDVQDRNKRHKKRPASKRGPKTARPKKASGTKKPSARGGRNKPVRRHKGKRV